MRVKRVCYSNTAVGSIVGTGIGAGIGALTGYVKNKRKKDGKLGSRMLAGAGIGAGIGAGTGALVGRKFGSKIISAYNKTFVPKTTITKVDASKFKPGDIVVQEKTGFSHYGIYKGDGKVIEFGSPTLDPRKTSVREVTLEEMAKGGGNFKAETPSGRFTREQIVKNAEAELRKQSNGEYNLLTNNCEHFARRVANGDPTSYQVANKGKIFDATGKRVVKQYSAISVKEGNKLLKDQLKALSNRGSLFGLRKNLSRDLGGMSHFDRNQSKYLMSGGGLIGSLTGYKSKKAAAKREAVEKYGLKKGSLEYDNFVRNRAREGAIKGAALGTSLGFGASKGIDFARGSAVLAKAKSSGLDLGTNRIGIGKSFRGINSSEDIAKIGANLKEVASYTNSLRGSIKPVME